MSATTLTMTCDDARQALGTYALGSVDDDERAAVEAHLIACPDCRAIQQEYEAVVGALALAVAPTPPPPSMRRALLATPPPPALATTRPGRPGDDRPAAPARPRGRMVVLSRGATTGLGLVASLLLVSVGLIGIWIGRAGDEGDEARFGQQEITEYMRDGAVVNPLLPPGVTAVVAGHGQGSLAVAPNQPGALLLAYNLTPSGKNRRYDVWAARGQERLTLGELWVDPKGTGWLLLRAPRPMTDYDTVGIAARETGSPAVDVLIARVPRSSAPSPGQ